MVITFDNVSFKYVDKPILDNVSFSLTDTDKIGIVGVNGTGKSTLLSLIMEDLNPNSGHIIKSGKMNINYLPQNQVFPKNKTIDEIMSEFESVEYERNTILNKLKLFDHSMVIENMSGGEKKRLSLAIALLKKSDILILDEPTNHLDNDMIEWLEKYLKNLNKGLVLVTHDRYFLERICTKMLELDNGKVYTYQANYTKFLELKKERIERELHAEQKLKNTLRRELKWIQRGCQARTTKSKSRIERFEKMSKIEFQKESNFNFSSLNTRLGKKLIEIKNGSKSYEKPLFKDFNFLLQRYDRIGIVGNNGCGKTTLFKIIMGEESLDSGELIKGETLNIGYFSQFLDEMDNEKRVIDYIKESYSYVETIDGVISAEKLLENFLFDSSKQYSYIKLLSGGEKRRLQLVKMLAKNPNLLILDEPTNDLDIYTLEVLEEYLDSFKGPVLIVSHDRYFLDNVCDKLLVFEGSNINEYNISFSEFLMLDKENQKKEKKDTRIKTVKMSSKDKNELYELEPLINKLEEDLKKLEAEEKTITVDYIRLMEITKEKEKLNKELEEKMERFFYLTELKESLENK